MLHARKDDNRIQDPENKIPEDDPVLSNEAAKGQLRSGLNAGLLAATQIQDAAIRQHMNDYDWQQSILSNQMGQALNPYSQGANAGFLGINPLAGNTIL